MPDLNRLLLFVALLSPVVVLVRTSSRAALNRGWQLAALIVLACTAAAWLLRPDLAGYVGAAVWLCLLFLPAVGLRKAADLVPAERYPEARRIVSALRWLHPTKGLRAELRFLQAMEAAQNGAPIRAGELLQNLRGTNNRAALQVIAQSFRIRGDWTGLLAWFHQNFSLGALTEEAALLPLYFRALGETGALDDLVAQVAARAPRLLASPQHEFTFDSCVMVMLAFTGRTETLTHLLETRFRSLRAEVKEFWIGTSELAAGVDQRGRSRLQALQNESRDALIRADIATRLNARQDLRVTLSPTAEITVRRFEKNLATRRRSILSPDSSLPTPAVTTLIALNVAMFLLEIRLGGTTNSYTLHRLGALEPVAVLSLGQYWRLLSALFLHYGPLHLLVNLYALYVLGPSLERSLGSFRFAACYLAAGIGSSAGVVAMWRFGWTKADLLVGASGAVMGIVGTWGGLLLRHRHVPMARRRLITIALIVLLQTAFDFLTPQVSMAAHLCGFLSGLIIGLLLAPHEENLHS